MRTDLKKEHLEVWKTKLRISPPQEEYKDTNGKEESKKERVTVHIKKLKKYEFKIEISGRKEEENIIPEIPQNAGI